MRLRARARAGAVLAWLAMGGMASGSEVAISPGGAITTSASSITFDSESIDVRCDITLNGSLDPGPIPYTVGETIGRITGGTTNACVNATVAVLAGTMRLANFAEFREFLYDVERLGFEITYLSGPRCLYGGGGFRLTLSGESSPWFTSEQFLLRQILAGQVSGPCNCPRTVRTENNLRFLLGPTQRLTLI